MNVAAERRAQRQAAAVLRIEASRSRLRGRLIRVKPAGGMAGTLASLSGKIAALVQRHPGFSAGGAVLLGALLVRARPWRFALKSGIWAVLVPRALPILAATLTASRLSSWSDLIMNWMRGDDDGKSTDAGSPPMEASMHAPKPTPAPTPMPMPMPMPMPAPSRQGQGTSARP